MTQNEKHTFTLLHKQDAEALDPKKEHKDKNNSFIFLLLTKNIVWFCRLRWMAVLILLIYGLLNFAPDLLDKLSLCTPGFWPVGIILFLSVLNFIYLYSLKFIFSNGNKWTYAKLNLWVQIIIDLLVLSIVIHNVGIIGTYFGFLYLFHIALACIFLSKIESFFVTIYSAILYTILLFIEIECQDCFHGIFLNIPAKNQLALLPEIYYFNLFILISIFFVLWYLISFLSLLLWKRSKDLRMLNERLHITQKIKDEYMLRTTHELKAPFAAIGSNVQLLKKGYCGDLSKEAMNIVSKIETRCSRLSDSILQMLQLTNLESKNSKSSTWVEIDLSQELEWCIKQIQFTASRRNIHIEMNLKEVKATVVQEQIRVLFSNILSNSVNYSYLNGTVSISCDINESLKPVLTFEDNGIGIAAKKIHKIFDEYYRTDEAGAHNKYSSGLGLAIVKKIAKIHAIDITVESMQTKGTKFILIFNKDV